MGLNTKEIHEIDSSLTLEVFVKKETRYKNFQVAMRHRLLQFSKTQLHIYIFIQARIKILTFNFSILHLSFESVVKLLQDETENNPEKDR